MTAALTRRAALTGAVASVAMVGAAVVVATPILAKQIGVSPDFAALLLRAEQASAAADRHDNAVHKPAYDRFTAAISQAEAETPHFSINAGPAHDGRPLIWSTDSRSAVSVTRTIVDMAREGTKWNNGTVALAREFQAAHLRRKRLIARATGKASLATNIATLSAENDALGDALYEAQNAVVDFPVQCAADLAAKIQCIIEWEMSERNDELLEDARRLANMEVSA